MFSLPRSFLFFLGLVAFGSLFMGCAKQEPQKSFEEFTFTDNDLKKVEQTVSESSYGTQLSGSSAQVTVLSAYDQSSEGLNDTHASQQSLSSISPLVIDVQKQKQYDNLRMGVASDTNVYRVNNAFLNVRSSMTIGSTQIERLTQGDTVIVTDIPNAQWAKVQMQDGKEGYVAFRYLAKITTDEKLADEKKQFEGKYFVDFSFLNIRKDPSAQSEKVGELPGQAIVKPLSVNGEWAHIVYDGKDGYVSSKYLMPFLPVFLVRQDHYTLPILQYRADDVAAISSLAVHMAALKNAGKNIVTLRYLYDTVLAQEKRDTRILPKSVVLTITGVNAKTLKSVSDALLSARVSATLFVETKDVGMNGLTEKALLTLLANGMDIQSEGHTGDDLRSLTDGQLSLELSQSKKMLEDILHTEVYAISYPQGGVNDRVMKVASQLGYLFGLSQVPDTSFSRDQFLRLPTLYVGSAMKSQDILALVH